MAESLAGRRTRQARIHKTVAGIGLAGLISALVPGTTDAAENGAGLYLLGSRGPMAGYLPPPGFYVENDVYFYHGKLGGDTALPTGGRLVANVRSKVLADFLTGTWVSPWQVLGGNLAFGAALPFGRVDAKAGVELDAPRLGRSVGRSLSDNATLFGDPVLTSALGWHAGQFHWSLAAMLNLPIGEYREGELANLSFHRWAGDLTGAVTWLDLGLGIDLSAAAGITFNGTNPATDYRTGTEFHLEWAATKLITKSLSMGLIGYHYQQITGDGGDGAPPGGFEGRVTALGGMVGYTFEIDKTPVTARIKVLQEFEAENRQTGTVTLVTLAFPFSGGK